MAKSLSIYIGKRYASLRSRNQLVGFISTLSILGLSIGVAILITVLSVINGFDHELQQRILALAPHISISTSRNDLQLSEDEWQSYQNIINENPHVTGTSPQLQLQGMLLANQRSKGIVLSGIDPAQESTVSILDDLIHSGSYASIEEKQFNILLGKGLAEHLKVKVGDPVSLASTVIRIDPMGEFLRQKTFTVSGIFSVGSQLDNSLAIVHMADAQRLYRLGNKINGIRVQVDDLFTVDSISNELSAELPINFSFATWIRDYGNIYERIRVSKTMVGLLLFLLVAVAAFNVVVSLFMVVRDKQGDIAILRTMGTPISSIRNIFLVQGFIIGLIGSGLGLLLGVILSLNVSDIVAWLEVLFDIKFISEDVYPVNYLPADIQLGDLILVCVSSLSLSIVATLYPAYTAAKVDPANALRHE